MKQIFFVMLLMMTKQVVAVSSNLDPLDDNHISCEEMRKYPYRVFNNSRVDLGSGHVSFTSVDDACKDQLNSMPFLKTIFNIVEKISNDPFLEGRCGGILNYSHWREYQFALLRASFAPEMLLNKKFQKEHKKIQGYFQVWAYQSRFNFRLYRAFFDEHKKVLPLLTRHYQKHFKFPHQKAHQIANNALMILMERAAGAFPKDLPTQLPEIVQQVIAENVDIDSIKEALNTIDQILNINNEIKAQHYLPTLLTNHLKSTQPISDGKTIAFFSILQAGDFSSIERILKNNINQALKAALLHNKPKQLIALLIDYLRTEMHETKDDESAIFFALHNKDYVDLLLGKAFINIDHSNGFGKTVLFYAIEDSNYAIIESLLMYGANPNHSYKSAKEIETEFFNCKYLIHHTKRTPLMHAAQHSTPKILELLLHRGARLDTLDEVGFNALDYAIKNKKTENIEFLRSLGIQPNIDHNK
jgi:uncharacterized protein